MSDYRASTRVEELLEQALFRGGNLMTMADIVEMARRRRVQVWGDEEALAVSEVLEYPRRRVLSIFAVAGSLRRLREFEPLIAEYARDNGASSMVCMTDRDGWNRIGRAHNWSARGVLWERVLKVH